MNSLVGAIRTVLSSRTLKFEDKDRVLQVVLEDLAG